MDINLGKLVDIELKVIENPKTITLARVKWILEKGEIKWGTISKSPKNYQEYWVQMPHFPFAKGKKGWTWPLIVTDEEVEGELFNAALKIFTGSDIPKENQTSVSNSTNDDEINLDDIPFD